MASAVFEGTSLVNMYVRGCWVNGIRRLIISRRGDEEEFYEIRTEWSDRNILYLHRSYSDLGRLFKRLLDSFPEDRPELSRSPLLQGPGTASPLPPSGVPGEGSGRGAGRDGTGQDGEAAFRGRKLLPGR
ncbi:PX domain-containing protein 1-like [Coturnix japonica]|uniref:PX domain containing 1 n=1 Tax=Coturnix japonica TaxID=93934 RepID=A0A8C2SVF8_COTJA|nr:PX domain-containing protein 1-like [Coturnix japonica]